MSKRFVHFFKQIYGSDNIIIRFCSRLAFAGSQSSVGNSLIVNVKVLLMMIILQIKSKPVLLENC